MPAHYVFSNAAVTDPQRLGAKAVLSATAQWFVWIKLEWAINSTSQGWGGWGGGVSPSGSQREKYNLKKMQRLAKAAKTSLVSRAKALEWRRFVEAEDARAERSGNSSALKEKKTG